MNFEETLEAEFEDIQRISSYGFEKNSLKRLDSHTVELNLLEGVKLKVELSLQGFKILSTEPKQEYEGKVYEQFDGLLSEISPKYRENFASLLFDGLTKLQ